VFNVADIAYLGAFGVPLWAATSWVIRRAFFTTRAW
jgi:hypothetical protein